MRAIGLICILYFIVAPYLFHAFHWLLDEKKEVRNLSKRVFVKIFVVLRTVSVKITVY